MSMQKAKNRNTANIVLLLAYTALTITLLLFHEPWRDEAQQWLFVKNQSFLSMLSSLHYEGHPALWYLMIYPLTRLGLGYGSVFILHTALVLFCGWLIIYRSPFSAYLKFFFLFSYALGYQYNAVARSYILVCVLLFLIAVIFPQRYGRYTALYGILLFLLINTHLLAALIAMVLIFYDFLFLLSKRIPRRNFLKNRQTKLFLLITAVCAAGLLLFYLTLRGPRYFYGAKPVTLTNFLTANYFCSGLNIFLSGMSSQLWSSLTFAFPALSSHTRISNCVTVFNTAIVGLSLLALLAYRFKAAFLVILFCLIYAAANVAGAPSNYWNAALVFIFFIFSFWISKTTPDEFSTIENKWTKIIGLFRIKKINLIAALASFSFLVGTGAAALAVYGEIRYPYSMASSTAGFIKEQGYDTQETCIVTPDFIFASSILPYLQNVKYFSLPGWSNTISYSTWDEECMTYAPLNSTLFNYARNEYNDNGSVPLVVYKTPADAVPDDFVCIYDCTDVHVFIPDERYCIYTLKQCANR